MKQLRVLFLGSPKPNKEQLQAISKLFYNLGTLLIGSVAINFFLSAEAEKIDIKFVIISSLLALLLYLWATRMLKEVK